MRRIKLCRTGSIGSGTCFAVLLPLGKPDHVQDREPDSLISGTGCILVVDDELAMRTTTEACLKQCGYHVLLAKNGKNAVSIYRDQSSQIDLVICDMVMPEMNGLDCFHHLQAINPSVRYILATGFTKPENIARMNEMGLAGLIKKPYRNTELSTLVSSVLSD